MEEFTTSDTDNTQLQLYKVLFQSLNSQFINLDSLQKSLSFPEDIVFSIIVNIFNFLLLNL